MKILLYAGQVRREGPGIDEIRFKVPTKTPGGKENTSQNILPIVLWKCPGRLALFQKGNHPARHDKIIRPTEKNIDWDVKPQYKQTNINIRMG